MTPPPGGPGTRRRAGVSTVLALLVLTAPLSETLAAAAPASSTAPRSSVSPTSSAGPQAPETAAPCPGRRLAAPDRPPVLAHFYQWFTAASWKRAKIDLPAAGPYSSNDAAVMRKQVAEARAAGFDGFIVGWKSTPVLNERLATLRNIAAHSDFKLAVTYQAQDFQRSPLPAAQVGHGLQELAATYATDPVFHVLGPRPVVALSGTWNYTAAQLRSITGPVASRLMVLATEKNVTGYERVASAVDGELYYWSSADPLTTPGYPAKMLAMANAARAHCGIWVAPVTPGYNARAIGGHMVVDRRDGSTLRSSWEGALATTPDAIGVISWNEWTENTYIEPSAAYGSRYLDVLRSLRGAPPIPVKELDSSGPEGAGSLRSTEVTAAAAVVFVVLVGLAGRMRRHSGSGGA